MFDREILPKLGEALKHGLALTKDALTALQARGWNPQCSIERQGPSSEQLAVQYALRTKPSTVLQESAPTRTRKDVPSPPVCSSATGGPALAQTQPVTTPVHS